MQSTNFEFLRAHARELADLGGFAEHYAHSDPASSLTKLRQYGENMVAAFYLHYRLPRQARSTFVEDLQNSSFRSSVPPVVLNKLHALRMQGNQAAHGPSQQITTDTALWLLEEAFDLGKWFCLTLHGDQAPATLEFQPPTPGDETKGRLKREKKEALQKLAAQEQQMKRLLQELEEAREKATATEETSEDRAAILASAEQAADVLDFDEARTRTEIIDRMLADAGWQTDNPDEVGCEVEVRHQPTDTGVGYADYVLWDDDGRPLGVIEAKRTSQNSEVGRTQAKLYADGLEQDCGRRPVIFYTNGYDLFILDDAKGDTPRQLFGYYSKDSLKYCHWQTQERQQPLEALGPDRAIIDRMYQIEAVKRICNRLDNNRRKALEIGRAHV